jgi:PIN domain nuclease of toxin-antitoxin system
MNLLLDTHALAWWLSDDPRLSPKAKEAIIDAVEVSYSLASFWELSILLHKKKHDPNLDKKVLPALKSALAEDCFKGVAISSSLCITSAALPKHHLDPFDRLIIATAKTDNLTLISKDRHFKQYEIDLLW